MSKILSLAGNDKGIALIVVESILLSLDILCVGLRLWARRIRNKSLELNDYTIIAALILMIARCINELLVVLIGGLGLHLTDVIAQGGFPAVIAFGKMAFVDDMLWLTLVGLVKLSILDLYRSLFANPLFQKINRAVMFLTILVALAFLLTQVLICRPVALNWDTTLEGKCGDITKKYIAVVVVDLIIDIIIIVLPMPVLWGLQMPIEKRFALIFVFGIGFFICAVCGVRLKWVLELDYTDPTYSLAEFGIFAALEPLLGIINACLPVIPLVFKEMIKKPGFMSNWKSTGRSTTANTGLSASRPSHLSNESSQQFVRLEDSEYQLADMSKKKGTAITITNEWTVKADQKSLNESVKHYHHG